MVEELWKKKQVDQVLDWSDAEGFSTRQKDFIHLPPVETSADFPYLTFMAPMTPSPDWYTGFYNYSVLDQYSLTYFDHVKIQTYAWDLGTDGGSTYQQTDLNLNPRFPVQRIVSDNAPETGELAGPSGGDMPVVGELECILVLGETPMILPSCDYFADPCCNETNTNKETCRNELTYEETPVLSPEYSDVLGLRPAMDPTSPGTTPASSPTTAGGTGETIFTSDSSTQKSGLRFPVILFTSLAAVVML